MKLPLFQGVVRSFSQLFAAVLLAFIAFGCASDGADSTASNATSAAPLDAASSAVAPTASAGSITLAAASVTASKGSQVCVPVTAKDFTAILSMQYTMKWDKEVLKFKEVRNFNLPDLAAANFGAQAAVQQGFLTHSWFDQQLQGITKADGEKLYEVCFEVVGKPGSKSVLEFTGTPTVVEIANVAEQFLQLKPEAGAVEVK